MKRILDVLRATFVSLELVCLLLPLAMLIYWPDPLDFISNLINADVKWGFGIACVPIVLLVGCYKIGTELLSPSGKRKVLLEWENYGMLKSRMIIALGFCTVSVVASLVGFYVVIASKSSFGAALIGSGCLSSAVALATVALARWRSREILGE